MHYVYEHWLVGKCFYVGKGSSKTNRAFNFDHRHRNEDWIKFVNGRENEIEVVIVQDGFETHGDAVSFEAEWTRIRRFEGCPIVSKLNGYQGPIHNEESRKKISRNNFNSGKRGKESQFSKLIFAKLPDGTILKTWGSLEMKNKLLEFGFKVSGPTILRNSLSKKPTRDKIVFWREEDE